MIEIMLLVCAVLCATTVPLFVGIGITRRQVRREAVLSSIAAHQYREVRVENEVAAQNRLQEMEHELLSPFFLELEANTWGTLGHNFGCRDCYPAKTEDGVEPEAPRYLTPDERRDICENFDMHDDSYERGYCKWCGESKPDDRDLWPGWGVG